MKPTMAAGNVTLRLRQPVRSRDGKRVGRVEGLVFIPESETLKEFVLHQGRIWVYDWFVACSYIDKIAPDSTVALCLGSAEIEELPAYSKAHYIDILPSVLSRVGLPSLQRSQVSAPPNSIIFDRNSPVEDCDGHQLGKLSGLVMSQNCVVSELEITADRGEQFALRIPLKWARSVQHDRIRLSRAQADMVI